VLFFPLLTPYAALLRRWLPTRVDQGDPSTPVYLDPSARETPVLALGFAAREALRLADVLEAMLQGLHEAFAGGDRRSIAHTKRLDDVLDKLNTAIKAYLTGLAPEALTEDDHRRVMEILTFATNMEQAGDIVEKNLLGAAAKKLKRGLAFSGEEQAALLGMIDRLSTNVRCAASLFMTGDTRAARLLASEKEAFREIEAVATMSHFNRLQAGRLEAAEVSALHLDALRDLKQVNTHVVAAAAYPVLEFAGDLLRSRVRQDED
jgi:phosphate:Na+ symporter